MISAHDKASLAAWIAAHQCPRQIGVLERAASDGRPRWTIDVAQAFVIANCRAGNGSTVALFLDDHWAHLRTGFVQAHGRGLTGHTGLFPYLKEYIE